MDEAQQDQYEAQLKEVFDSFDTSGSGSLGQEELSELCRALHLEKVAPTLLHTLLPEEGLHTDRVHFEQFKDALILVLSATLGGPLSNPVDHPEPVCNSAEVVPKFVKDGKRYGRRSTPEGRDPTAGSCEVIGTVQALNEPEDSPNTSVQNDSEHCSTSVHNSEEYEAEGQLHFWNPDDLGTPRGFAPSPDELEECLQGACEELGLCRDGFASHQELLSVCARLGLEVVEDVFQKLDSDGVMRVQDFVSGIVRSNNPPTPSASTPYRQLKRHHSTQPFDESGRRTTTPSAMTSTIGLRLFSTLDDGSGYASAEQLLDTWQEEGIENGPEILQALDFGLERKVNLSELTIALENELLITKNGIHQAVLASFKAEIRYLLECVDRELREKRKVQADLEKADKLKTQMATEVDEHHSAIERLNDYNLRKLEMEHRDKLAAVKSELTRELDHIQQQATRQRAQLEREVEKVKEEEAFLRDRLSLTLKENGRLEAELLENTEKLVESENLVGKLQKNLENILKEKFGDLDPGSAEFFLQEERLRHLRSKYEEQCRELQDRIDELQEELEEYRTLGRTSRPFFKPSLSEEFDSKSPGIESDPGLGSEDCPPFNMSLEAEMLIEQLKDQHVRDLETLRGELDGKVSQYEQQLEELKGAHEQQRRELAQRCQEEKDQVQRRAEELQNLLDAAQTAQEGLEQSHAEERAELERRHAEEVAERDRLHSEDRVRLEQQHEAALQGRLEEQRQRLSGALEERERQLAEEWERQRSLMEESHREAVQELSARHSEERERLNGLVEKLKQDFLEERKELERHYSQKIRELESRFSDQEAVSERLQKDMSKLELRHQNELQDLTMRHTEEKAQWEFEKEEILRESEEEMERLRDSLKREKECVSQEFEREREMMEKSYKEQLNGLIAKNEQVQHELEAFIHTAKVKESELTKQLADLPKDLQQNLNAKDELLIQAQKKADDLELLLKQAVEDFEQEKAEIQGQLTDLEEKNKENLNLLEKQWAEIQSLVAENSRLQIRILELGTEVTKMSKLQERFEEVQKENEEALCMISHLKKRTEELEAKKESLTDLQTVKIRYPDEKTPTSESSIGTEPQVSEEKEQGCDSDSDLLKENIRKLEKPNEGIHQLQDEVEQAVKARKLCHSEMENLHEKLKQLQDQVYLHAGVQAQLENAHDRNLQLQQEVCHLEKRTSELEVLLEDDAQKIAAGEQSQKENKELRQDISRMIERTKDLEGKTKQLIDIQSRYEECTREKRKLQEEKMNLENKVHELEEKMQGVGHIQGRHSKLQKQVARMVEENSKLCAEIQELKKHEELKNLCQDTKGTKEVAEMNVHKKETFQDLNSQLEAKIQAVSELEDSCTELEREKAKLQETVAELQEKCQTLQEKMQAHRDKIKGVQCVMSVHACLGNTFTAQYSWKLSHRIYVVLECLFRDIILFLIEPSYEVVYTRSNPQFCTLSQTHLTKQLKSVSYPVCLQCRGEAGRLAEENLILKWEISKFKEEGNISQQELKDLNKSQEEMLRKIDQLKKEKTAALTMNESLKNQVLELRSRGQQLEDENGLLSHKSAQNAADVLELNRRLSELLKQREKKASSRRQHHQGELERERAALAAEFAQERSQMAARLSGLEKEMATAQERSAQLEQERALMSQELSTLKEQLCSSRDLRSELASAVSRSEKLQREKETLSEELSRCVDKVAKLGTMENQLSHLRQERQAAEQQAQNLKTQLSASLDKVVQALDEALQTVNLQTARLKSDLRVTQQEKEALKQEVMSLHKQLQNANNKNQFLELALHSSGYQSHQKKLYWEELSRLVDQEQQLLRQENERLQKEVQNTKGDLILSRDKTRQLESTILSLKQQKQQGQSSLVKAVEQEKLGVKRELDSVRKELLIANRKVSEQSESQREMESLRQENENLKARQARLETQLLELQQVRLTICHKKALQLQQLWACCFSGSKQFLQTSKHSCRSITRTKTKLDGQRSKRTSFITTKEGQEVVLLKMEERMRDVEQKLRNVKLLLQEKVTQLKDQLQKNAKADELIKDLYVENSQLLKALELTEQRQKVAEKKNYLLEEKISSLNKIVRDLSPSPLTAVPYHFS
uniref:Ninein n=1 Tax=Lepisosteus oculatus TaxID=7918 RepID=W5N1Z9_LEPOC